jgi:TonB family protein
LKSGVKTRRGSAAAKNSGLRFSAARTRNAQFACDRVVLRQLQIVLGARGLIARGDTPIRPARDRQALAEFGHLGWIQHRGNVQQHTASSKPRKKAHQRLTGLVILRVLIDEGGHAKTVEVYRSSGHPRLDEAARTAVARAVFKPYIDGGIARASAAMVPVEFSLRCSAS